MAVILVGGEKGGAGKTTDAINLAVMRAIAGSDVLLLDADKQLTTSTWETVRGEEGVMPRVPTVQKLGSGIPAQVQDFKGRYADIIIDSGGRDTPELRYCLAVADKAFIPVLPSDFDTWTLRTMDRLVEMAKAFNPELKAYILIGRASTHPQSKEVEDTIKDILAEKFEHLTLAETVIYERVAYRKAARNGRAIVELLSKDRDEKALAEIEAFYQEVFK